MALLDSAAEEWQGTFILNGIQKREVAVRSHRKNARSCEFCA